MPAIGQADIFVFYGLAAVAATVIKTTYTIVDRCPVSAIWFGILVDVVLAMAIRYVIEWPCSCCIVLHSSPSNTNIR